MPSDQPQEKQPLLKEQERRREQIAAIGRISDAFADVPIDELERQIQQVVDEARAELRTERRGAATR